MKGKNSRKGRIAGVFWHSYPDKWNPVYTHTLRMMKGLVSQDEELVFLTNKKDSREPADELVDGVHVKRSEYLIRRKKAGILSKFILFMRWVILFQFQEIRHCRMVYVRDLLLSTLVLCKLLRKPLVVEKNDVDEANPNARRNIVGRLHYGSRLRALDFVNAIIVQTEESKRSLEKMGFPSKKLLVVPNGVDTDLFSFQEKDISGKVKLLYIAHLDENKSLDLTLSVAKEMADDVEVTIVGDGPRRREFEDIVENMGLQNVLFIGVVPHNELPEVISAHDFGIGEYNLEYREFKEYGFFFFPLKILEYLSCGRPVFVNISNTVILDLERSGTVFRFGRKENVIQLINDFRSNPKKTNETQRKAREKALDFDWEQSVGILLKELRSLKIL